MSDESQSGNGQRRGDGAKPGGRAVQADPSRILIVLPNWVGDMVLATPAVGAIRARFPRAQITGLVKSYMTEVLGGWRLA